MATLTVEAPDHLTAELTRLFAGMDKDALVTALLIDLLDRVRRFPSAKQAIANNPDLPIGFRKEITDHAHHQPLSRHRHHDALE